MEKFYRPGVLGLLVGACFGMTAPLFADQISSNGGTLTLADGRELGFSLQNASRSLASTEAYKWWYGCSPTAAGMVLGFYDRNGYAGKRYDNLVPGGVAESNTFGAGPYLINSVIASPGHISDFYGGGYNVSGDDKSAPFHAFNSLADFMGISQDSVGNSNGSTTFYFYSNGSPFTTADALRLGVSNMDGMYGIGEYLSYAGYGFTSLYTQLIYSSTATQGFTYDQYMAEIDAGRPVIIQLNGHSVFGYGYNNNPNNNQVYFYDTWSSSQQTLTWGGSYAGMAQWGVEVLSLSGGTAVPLPTAAWSGLVLLAGLGLKRLRRR